MRLESRCWPGLELSEGGLGLKDSFQGSWLPGLASWCWSLAGGLSYSPPGPLCRAAWGAHNMEAGFPPPESDPRARGRSHMSCKPWSQNHLSSPLPYSVRRESLTLGEENLESAFWRCGIKEFAHCKKTHHNYLDTFKSKLSKLNGMFQRYFTMNYTLFYTHCLLVYNALLCLIL